MDLEFTETLRALAEYIENFIDNTDELVHNADDDDKEYSFMEDESGISNTEIDNLIHTLTHGLELTTKLIKGQ